MRAVELEPVEAACDRPTRRRDELRRARASMSSRVIARGTWLRGPYAIADGATSGQLPSAQRLVGVLPAELRRALRARVAELQRDLRRRARVHVIDDAPPRVALRIVVQAGAAGADARIRRDARHLGEHEARAAVRAAAQVHEVVVVGHAVDARVLRHRRDDDRGSAA